MDSETTFWSNKLKEIRSKKHLTQQQLAVSLGISSKTVYRLEHSSEVPSKKLQNLLTQTFPEYFEMIQISDTELFHIFEDLLSHLFKGEKILTSNETPQDIFQKIIHAYFSSRDWNSNSWKYDEAVPKQTIFFYIPEVNFDSLLSALFTKDHSGSSDEIKTLIWLQEAVFLLANKLFFELFAPHILSDYDKKQEEILERTRKETHIDELRALPNTPDISLLLYHLRTIKKISFSRICKILDQLCSHLEQGTFHKEQPLIDYVVSNLKVTPQKLRNCEHGTSSPSLPLLEALAWIFNLKNLSSILYYPTNNLFSQKRIRISFLSLLIWTIPLFPAAKTPIFITLYWSVTSPWMLPVIPIYCLPWGFRWMIISRIRQPGILDLIPCLESFFTPCCKRKESRWGLWNVKRISSPLAAGKSINIIASMVPRSPLYIDIITQLLPIAPPSRSYSKSETTQSFVYTRINCILIHYFYPHTWHSSRPQKIRPKLKRISHPSRTLSSSC